MPGKPGAPEAEVAGDEERYWRDMQAYYKDPSGWGLTHPPFPIPPRCKCGRDGYTVHGVLKHLEDNSGAGEACQRGDVSGLSRLQPPQAKEPSTPAPSPPAPIPPKTGAFGKKR